MVKASLFKFYSTAILSLASVLGPIHAQTVSNSSQSNADISIGQCKGEIRALKLGDSISNRIASNEVQCYGITLEANQFMHVVVMQKGVDVILQLFRKGGEKIGEAIDSPNGEDGPEPASEVAGEKADYILAVKSQDPNATNPIYSVTLEAFRTATVEDNNYVIGERAFIAGQLAFNEAQGLAANGQSADAGKKINNAIISLERALSVLKTNEHIKLKIQVLRQLGTAYAAVGKSEQALACLAQLRDLTKTMGDPSTEASALIGIGDTYALMGKPELAKEAYEAIPLIKGDIPLGQRAFALGKLGDLELGRDVIKAIDLYEQAVLIYRSMPEPNREAEMLTWIGAKYFDRAAVLQAREHYEQALRVVGLNDPSVLANTYLNYGVTLGQSGERQAALDSFNKSQQFYAEVEKATGRQDFEAQAYLLHGIGYAYSSLDQQQTALEYYRRALEFSSPNHRLPDAEAFEHLYSGVSYYRLGENEKGLEETNIALAIWKKLNNNRGQAMALVNAGQFFYDQGDKVRALAYLEQALPLQKIAGDLYGQAYTLTNIAKIYSDQGKTEEAMELLKVALPIREQVSDRSGEVITRQLIGKIKSAQNELKEAQDQLERAIDRIEFLRASIASEDLRASYFATVFSVYLLEIDVLMRLEKQHPGEGYAEKALKINESIRARNLLEGLVTAKVDLLQAAGADLVKKEKALQHKLSLSLSRKILFDSSNPTQAQRAELNREIEGILEELRNNRVKLERTNPEYVALADLKPLPTGKIEGLVDPETLLLEFALGDERSYLWLVSNQRVLSFELPSRSKIEGLAVEAIKRVTERNRTSTEKRIAARIKRERAADLDYLRLSKNLSQILMGQTADKLGSKRLVIVADGALQYFPFSALPSPDQANNRAWEPLIVKHEIVVLPSASVLSSIRETLGDRAAAPQLMAVLTDPAYELKPNRTGNDQQNDARRTASAQTGLALHQLGFAKREIRAIKESVRKVDPQAEVKVWDGPNVNLKNATSDELKRYRIIHYSAHGKLDSSRPESSGIVLSLYDHQGKPTPDFFMGLKDVYHMKLSADLVVLSACESALGKEVKGEGVVGLTRGFMYAGSRRVVSSLWEVDEFQTADLMARFYQHLLEGNEPTASALRLSQLFMWQTLKLPPYYWAAFQLQGEWRGKLRPQG